jgi:hypothetical protein
MQPHPAQRAPSGRHRPRMVDRTGERPAGRPAMVIVEQYWARRRSTRHTTGPVTAEAAS